MQGPSIEFEHVGLTLGATSILEDINFSIAAGSIHCIIGANGGGKTSLVRSMLGQMPHSGRIAIHWHDNRVVGYVPQALDFDKTLPVTVNDFMGMTCQRRPVFLGISRARRREIDEVLDRMGLAGKGRYKLGNLSGGERQRVLFAQALIPEPALLVLDEPMTGLDVGGRDLLVGSIVEFAGAGGTVVWINHDIAQVNEIADTLTYVDRKVRLQGNAREVLRGGAAAGLFPSLELAGATTS
ncbi:MAG: metal ABC transporter ATP-binding protein [Gammaproteobacteria bacterium]|nr:metal ABC transporter ATP-binding protein [Gammaproteobacteria bacterium]MDH3506200.1 metal ABC transporter ATP-binding protein [Gammaproteobacteria bacterium]